MQVEYQRLPVEVSDGQEALLTASDDVLPGDAHVGHLLLQWLTAQVLPVDGVQVEEVLILQTVNELLIMTMQHIIMWSSGWFIVDEAPGRDLKCGFALHAGVHQQVTLPRHGQVGDGHWQRALARRPQAAHVLSPPHRVDDHCPVLMRKGPQRE